MTSRQQERKPAQKKLVSHNTLQSQINEKHKAARERDQLVATLARIMPGSHFSLPPRSPSSDPAVTNPKASCCIHLPDGRTLRWFIPHYNEHLFSGIPVRPADHTGSTNAQRNLYLEEITLQSVIEGIRNRFSQPL